MTDAIQTKSAQVLLDEIWADAGYMFGRVAVDGSCTGAMTTALQEKINAINEALRNLTPQEPGSGEGEGLSLNDMYALIAEVNGAFSHNAATGSSAKAAVVHQALLWVALRYHIVPKDGVDLRTGERLRAALSEKAPDAGKAVEWQPIESAPRDGSVILTCRATKTTKGKEDCGLKIIQSRYFNRSWCNGEGAHYKWAGWAHNDEPTHWQPLPAPPKAALKAVSEGGHGE